MSVAYIGPKSRTERPRKTKIGIQVAHVTCDSDTTFKVKRSRSPGCFAHRRVGTSGGCSGGHENVLAMETAATLPSARRQKAPMAEGVSAPTGGRRGAGAYRGGRPPTSCYYYYVIIKLGFCPTVSGA